MLFLAILVATACGAAGEAPRVAIAPPARHETSVQTPSPPRRDAEVPESVAALFLRCEAPEACPPGIAIVVDANGVRGTDGHPNRCTGVLVGTDRLLTASHCLAPGGRRAGASCESTWIGFAAAGPHPREWIACERVVHANDVRDDEVMRPDWAVLELGRSTGRPALRVDASPPAPHSIVQVVSVTPHAIYRSHHAIGTRLCRVRTTEEATELFGADAARVGWLSDCPSYPGNSGAPILDREGRVRGILHGGSGAWPDIGVTTPAPRF